ncbi:reducing type I polyketide synthase [Xylariaceae sp. AK1471]|nr:reducing type I polyketide synthase [Xylariaceae sp. AK1471]
MQENGATDANHLRSVKEPTLNLHSAPRTYVQVPVAVIGMACRLPGHSNTPRDFWDFMMRGGIASNEPPANRFNLSGHFDASRKPYTMKTPGAMFMEDIDPADFDAQFFNINETDAIAMDPQQRNLMEVAYECLENAGMPIEKLSGQRIGCLVGASAVDYYDMDLKDVEDRTDSPTLGSSRSLLSNRISHFLNVHGPSLSVDTACSSALTALDMACLYLGSNQVDGMFVGGVNMYLSPERNEDMGNMRAAASPTGKCHAFDNKADGYVAAEAINVVFLKRLQDAVRDGDPIRGVIRATSTNSAGKTPGIANPNPIAQAKAIRDAYANAGLAEVDLSDTGYLECHGTGTLAGDPVEIEGVATVFAPTRPANRPLSIGSVKSNVGHSEAASGLTSLIKVILAIEKGVIPGTATFLDPNPRIDFEKSRVKAFRNPIKWPQLSKRRASINSFGFGGANAHAIIESPEYLLGEPLSSFKSSYVNSENISDDFFSSDTIATNGAQPNFKLVIVSANDETALKASIRRLSSHLLHPGVEVTLDDLGFTLSERRSRLYHRAYSIQKNTSLNPSTFVTGKLASHDVKVGFVFTGQGAQWPMMGRDLLRAFPIARKMIETLDTVLANLTQPPSWSLKSMLTDEPDPAVLRDPEFSQPIVTALQLAYLEVLSDWGIKPVAVVGHSSGEIAAAVATGRLTAEGAIKIAFLRGQAAKELRPMKKLGMLAVGISVDAIESYIDYKDDPVQVACINSPRSVTLSGTAQALERLMHRLTADDHFARMLQVDFAYHSTYMDQIAERYSRLLQIHTKENGVEHCDVTMFSSVTGGRWSGALDLAYWVRNLKSQVQFHQAVEAMIDGKDGANFLIEVGPSNALAGPLSQICDSASHLTRQPICTSVAARGPETLMALYGVAGKLFLAGGPVDLRRVNGFDDVSPSVVIDLPNYPWNRSKKYWHESLASKDWRFRPFVKHDLLGSKIPGTSWQHPVWKNKLKLDNNAWLADHKLGNKTVLPGTGYICMAMEAIYQAAYMTKWKGEVPETYAYRLRNIRFLKALMLDDLENPPLIMLTLNPPLGSNAAWYEFNISAERLGTWGDHASGFIRIDTEFLAEKAQEHVLSPFEYPMSNGTWYKRMRAYGFNFGPAFQKIIAMESSSSQRTGRSKVSLQPPTSKWTQSSYPLHPACMDGCFQSVTATWDGDSRVMDTLIPLQIDSLFVPFRSQQPEEGISAARSDFTGVGRVDVMKNYAFSCAVYHPDEGSLVFDMKGIRYATLGNAEGTSSSHAYCHLSWDADITLLDEAAFKRLVNQAVVGTTVDNAGGLDETLLVAHRLINLVAHKNPLLNVIEVNLETLDASSLWLDNRDPIRAAFSQYTFTSSSADTLVEAKQKYSRIQRTEYIVVDLEHPQASLDSKYDLAIVKMPLSPVKMLSQSLEAIQSWLKATGMVLLIDTGCTVDSLDGITTSLGLETLWESHSVSLTCKASSRKAIASRDVWILRFKDQNDQYIQGNLDFSSWNIFSVTDVQAIPPGSKVLIVDELWTSVLTNLDQPQWATLQCLVDRQCHVLWVTTGAQMVITNPETALISGLFRTIRNETPFLTLINLDVESPVRDTTVQAIEKCLGLLESTDNKTTIDSEFAERDGILNISRILPDSSLNRATEEEVVGKPLEMMPLKTTQGTIKLRAERVGNLDSLQYCQISVEPPPLADDWVEIDILTSGVNFKDVASVIGLVPENEHLLGGEGSGIITRTGSAVSTFSKGQRVVFFKRGSFGNRVHASTKVVHHIPEQMSFEEAATVPCVFATSIYALFRLAQMKKGDRVLIHSATGGVGISAIQLCHYVGAEVYATVGTQKKRDFLKSNYGIGDDRIFSSRNTEFAQKIMQMTDGKGVDIILNSLAGDLLDESWRIIATGGTMVEIGKKDILDRNMLSMEPFNRNASFRALDLSHENISDDTLSSLLSETFDLLEKSCIKPITPIQVFPFDKIPDALRLMRGGKHIGKIVISRVSEPDLRVPVRGASRSINIRSNMCYLIVGGLRGLSSSLAIHLAKNGAANIAVLSRSGHCDEKSQQALSKLHALNCKVDMIKGDVTCIDDVRRAFRSTSVPIGGIIQGAMVLCDRPFSSMTVDEYHTALRCKVQGTWNLHHASLEQDLSLEFFTLLSSISGTYGSKGQANYAAANAFLDAFASYRNRLGLPACSIDLGVIGEVGYMAEHDELMNRYDETVWHVIGERVLRKTLELSIYQQGYLPINARSASQMIMGLRVPQPEHSPLSRDARFAGLFSRGHGTSSQDASHQGPKDLELIWVMIRSKAGARAILETTTQALNKYLMKILRVSEPLDFARPLSAYGIDSLAAVEVRNLLKVELGVELTTLEIINASSLISVCERIIEEISKLE